MKQFISEHPFLFFIMVCFALCALDNIVANLCRK